MSEISAILLNAVTTYGLPVASVVFLLGALGLPLPCTVILIMLGAFVRENIFNAYSTALVALLSSVSGDLIVFGVGRLGRSWIPSRILHSAGFIRIEGTFYRHAAMAIFLTRWLMTPLALPTSLIAGNSKYPLPKFLVIDALGQATWVGLFGGLGYAFSSQLDLISQIFSNVTGLITGLIILVAGAYAVFRFSGFRVRRTHLR